MKKMLCVLLAVAILICPQKSLVYASEYVLTTTSQAIQIDLLGQVETNIISVVIPTQVKFVAIPEETGWNKILSPNFAVQNTGKAMLNVSITKATVNTPGIKFTNNTPNFDGTTKQIRLAVAPKATYGSITGVQNYLLNDAVSSVSPIALTKNLDYSASANTATYNVYGDISTGWVQNEEFSVSAVFMVSVK